MNEWIKDVPEVEMKKRTVALVLAALLVIASFSGCVSLKNPAQGKKVAYVMYMKASPIFELWADSFEESAQKLGMSADTFFCNDSDEEWRNRIERCADEGYDGVVVSHGGESYAWSFLSGIVESHPNFKIVTFDTFFKDEEGRTRTIDGVVQLFQRDSGLAAVLVEEILSMYPEKTAGKERVNVLKVQEMGYIAAFDRREVGYRLYETVGKINTVETIAPVDHLNAVESMKEVAKSAIEKYEDGEIDAIWCCYDAYAQGVYQALKECGSNIPLVSIDISNIDIQDMQEGLNWKACATTNWSLNGEFALRVLALEMAGDYDSIKAASCYYESPGMWMEIPSVIVRQNDVMARENVSIENLGEVVDGAYTDKSWMPSTPWISVVLDK